MPSYLAYQVMRDGSQPGAIEFESSDDQKAEAYVREIIGPHEAAALYEGQRIVKLMRARPRPN